MGAMSMWKNGEMDDLLARAADVAAAPAARRDCMSASEAACALAGIVAHISTTRGHAELQRAAAQLARSEHAWATALRDAPTRQGLADESSALLMVVCRGLVEMAGVDHLRAALSWWATESDPAVWRQILSGAR